MKKLLKYGLFIILAGVVSWGFITPNGIRAAFANNLWSLKFMQNYYGSDSSEVEFPEPPKMYVNSGLFLASQAMRQNNLEQAKIYLTPLVEKGDLVALNNYAEILYLQEDYAGAFAIWERTGNILRLHGVVNEAAESDALPLRSLAYQSLYRLDPERYTFPYADSLNGINDYRSAVSVLENSIRIYNDSDSYAIWLKYLGDTYRSQKIWREAEKYYQQILFEQPGNWQVAMSLCTLLYDQNNDLEKLDACLVAVESPSSENGTRFYEISRFYWQIGQKDRAVQAVELAVQFSPTDIDLLLQAGGFYEQVGLPQRALAAYNAVVVLDSNNDTALNAIDRLTDSN